MKKILFFITILFLYKCDPSDTATQKGQEVQEVKKTSVATTNLETTSDNTFKFPYNLSKPDVELKLSKKLTEISGLSLTEDQEQFIAINDEQGKLFFLNKTEGKLLAEEKFHKKGDYEGIEAVGEKIYIAKHNGTIYEYVEATKGERPTPKAYNTFLNEKNDVEGLGYDASINSLLLACKGKAGKGLMHQRAVYAFDLATKKLQAKPIYQITQTAINEYLEKNPDEELEHLVVSDKKDMVFSPSGIAIQPQTKNIYILSSVGKILLVLDKLGKKILTIQALEKKITKQPEGITFDKKGTLYISSEGRSGKGRIFHFKKHEL